MSSYSLPLSRSPSPYVAPDLPDKDFFEDFSPENPEDAVPFWDDNYFNQEAYSFRWEDDVEFGDEASAAETDGPCPTTSPGFGREIGNVPLQASPLRARGVAGQDSLPPANPFLAGEDTLPQVRASLLEVSSHNEVEDDEDEDASSIFGNDLDDLVLYYSSRPMDAEDEEDDASEVEVGDVCEDEDECDDEDECEDEDEDADGDEDEDDVIEGGEVACGPVSPDSTPECAAEEEESVVEGNDDTDESPSSPCDCTTGEDRCTPESERPAQAPEDDVNQAAPVAQSQTRPRRSQEPRAYTFPPLADLTREIMDSWSKDMTSAFLRERCMVDPNDVVECAVPRVDGRPCGKWFLRKEISKARRHYRAEHFPDELKVNDAVVVCPWPGCGENMVYRDTGRHLNEHWGVRYQCPFCPSPPMPRSDSCQRHILDNPCEGLPAACREPRRPTARGKAIVQPEAGPGPSTQRKRQARARTRQQKPQPRARVQPKQPEAGPSRGKKRSRRCVEEEEEEIDQEEDSEAGDDNGDDSDWIPTKSDRKGKGKAPERKRKKR